VVGCGGDEFWLLRVLGACVGCLVFAWCAFGVLHAGGECRWRGVVKEYADLLYCQNASVDSCVPYAGASLVQILDVCMMSLQLIGIRSGLGLS
jgi:hypothetical protein